jgi:type II secretory pathway pseudopilin PulG
MTRLRSEDGMTLIETSVATGILVVVLSGLLSVLSLAAAITENEGHLSARAAEYAQDKMEQLIALAYSDAASDTTQIPTAPSNGTGLAIGGSADPNAPIAKYLDFLDDQGKPLCPCAGTAAPDTWFYKRVWQISAPAGTANIKQITVTVIVAHSIARKIIPTSTVTTLRARIGNE